MTNCTSFKRKMAATASYSPLKMMCGEEYIREEYNSEDERDTISVTDSWSDFDDEDEEMFGIGHFDVEHDEINEPREYEEEYEIRTVELLFDDNVNQVKIYPVKCLRNVPVNKYFYDVDLNQVYPDYREDERDDEDDLISAFEMETSSGEYKEIQVRVEFKNEKQNARIHTIRIPRDAYYEGFEYDEENDRVIPKFTEGSWRYQLCNESEQEEKIQKTRDEKRRKDNTEEIKNRSRLKTEINSKEEDLQKQLDDAKQQMKELLVMIQQEKETK